MTLVELFLIYQDKDTGFAARPKSTLLTGAARGRRRGAQTPPHRAPNPKAPRQYAKGSERSERPTARGGGAARNPRRSAERDGRGGGQASEGTPGRARREPQGRAQRAAAGGDPPLAASRQASTGGAPQRAERAPGGAATGERSGPERDRPPRSGGRKRAEGLATASNPIMPPTEPGGRQRGQRRPHGLPRRARSVARGAGGAKAGACACVAGALPERPRSGRAGKAERSQTARYTCCNLQRVESCRKITKCIGNRVHAITAPLALHVCRVVLCLGAHGLGRVVLLCSLRSCDIG